MTTVTFDYELLRQPFQEKALAGAAEFRTVYDGSGRPVIFSIDHDGKLLLLAPGTSGEFKTVNLSKQLGVQDSDKVLALAVTQARDHQLHICLSSGDGQAASKLWIFRPFQPTLDSWYDDINPGSALVGPAPSTIISKLLLASACTQKHYIATVVAEVGAARKDVCRVDVNPSAGTWSWATDLSFPFNIDDMTDYCVGRIPGSSGIFGIDKTQGRPTLTFAGVRGSGPGPRASNNYNLPIVANPNAVATTLDEDGFTNVLVAGDGILHISSQDCVDSVDFGTVEKPTIQDASLMGIKKLTVGQDGQAVSIWALNGDSNMVGQSATLKLDQVEGVDKLVSAGAAVPLLAARDQVQALDAILDSTTGTQRVFCLNKDGSASHLQRPGNSQLWTEEKLRVPDPENVQHVNTYSCNMRIRASTGQPLAAKHVQLSASVDMSCVVNGWYETLGPSASPVKTDSQGGISIIIPAPDLNVPSITISGDGITPQTFQPATKAVQKLSSTARAGKLGSVRTQDGKPMFPDVSDSASKAIVALAARYVSVNDASPQVGPASNGTLQATTLATGDSDSHGFLWQFWHGLVSGVEEILDFVYEAGAFIVRTANKVWKFIVDTAEQALSALSGIFKIIGAAIEDAITWLASLLDWDSILDTMSVFDEFFNSGINMVQDLIAQGGDAVDSIFEGFEKEVGSWHMPPVPPQQVASLKPNLDKEKKSSDTSFTNSPGFNWINNHIESGDTKDRMATVAVGADKTDFTDVLKSIYDEIFAPLWENFKDTLSGLWQDIKQVFSSDSPLSWGDVFKNIGTDL
ncbi:hypothetical protein F66182_1170 [Fusarium sp. NRRL 66182]|nr:hypothetical protein F66182_1170 [Fusarium sp. NRRL 66182]